jgi:predicted DNA-binding protein YlxM (UPF0122 family)
MEKKLTKKQKGFVKDFIKTGNGVKSALKNYDTKDYSTAGSIAVENLQKPAIKEAIKSIADSIPDELLIEKHLELLNVPKITKTMKNGEYTDIEESTDVQAIKAGLDMAYKLKGAYAPQQTDITSQGEKITGINYLNPNGNNPKTNP